LGPYSLYAGLHLESAAHRSLSSDACIKIQGRGASASLIDGTLPLLFFAASYIRVPDHYCHPRLRLTTQPPCPGPRAPLPPVFSFCTPDFDSCSSRCLEDSSLFSSGNLCLRVTPCGCRFHLRSLRTEYLMTAPLKSFFNTLSHASLRSRREDLATPPSEIACFLGFLSYPGELVILPFPPR